MRTTLGPACVFIALAVAAPATAEGWSGAYGGFQFGLTGGEASGAGGGSATAAIAGVHAGYGVELGTFVLGAEVDLDFGSVELGDVDVDSLSRLKLRAGTEIGRSFVYGTAGIARADTSIGTGDGGFAGIGAGWRLGARTTIGGEVIYQQFDDIEGSGRDVSGTTATARVTFSF